ncbi:hypothetical protein Hte_009210 [Hypoxylon texense]
MEVDSLEFSPMIQDFSEASAFRLETATYLRESLSRDQCSKAPRMSSNPLITCFGPVGEAISRRCSDRMSHFCFKDNNNARCRLVLSPYIGLVESFLNELLFFIDMCEEEQELQMTSNLPTVEEYMKRRMGSSGTQSQVDTLIPLLVVRLGSVQAAVDYATDMIRSSIQRLEVAEKDILNRYETDPKAQDIQRYIDGCKFACTANLNWRSVSRTAETGSLC